MGRNEETLTVVCPHCAATLRVDAETGTVVASKACEKREMASFDDAFAHELERQGKQKDLFAQALENENKRKSLLEKKFQEAQKDVGDGPVRPHNPFDLD